MIRCSVIMIEVDAMIVMVLVTVVIFVEICHDNDLQKFESEKGKR